MVSFPLPREDQVVPYASSTDTNPVEPVFHGLEAVYTQAAPQITATVQVDT